MSFDNLVICQAEIWGLLILFLSGLFVGLKRQVHITLILYKLVIWFCSLTEPYSASYVFIEAHINTQNSYTRTTYLPHLYWSVWFTLLQPQVPNSLSPDLVISPVHLKDAGFYICRVNCGDSFEFSQWAQVDVLNVHTSCGMRLHFPSLCVQMHLLFEPLNRFYICCIQGVCICWSSLHVRVSRKGDSSGSWTSNLKVCPEDCF